MLLLTNRLAALIEKRTFDSAGCKIWLGMVDSGGYAKAKISPYWPKGTRISRVVLAVKLGRIPNKVEWACHTCDNPLCVEPSHIYCGNATSNNRDTVRRGRHRCQYAKTDDGMKREIVSRYITGGISQEKLAKEYGISQVRVSQIVRRHLICQY